MKTHREQLQLQMQTQWRKRVPTTTTAAAAAACRTGTVHAVLQQTCPHNGQCISGQGQGRFILLVSLFFLLYNLPLTPTPQGLGWK